MTLNGNFILHCRNAPSHRKPMALKKQLMNTICIHSVQRLTSLRWITSRHLDRWYYRCNTCMWVVQKVSGLIERNTAQWWPVYVISVLSTACQLLYSILVEEFFLPLHPSQTQWCHYLWRTFFRGKMNSFYKTGIHKLQEWWNKCIEVCRGNRKQTGHCCSGFPRLLECPGIFIWKFQGLESPMRPETFGKPL